VNKVSLLQSLIKVIIVLWLLSFGIRMVKAMLKEFD